MTQLWDLSGIQPNHDIVMPGETIPAMFWNAVKQRGPKVWTRQKHLGLWRSQTWNQTGQAVADIAGGYAALTVAAEGLEVTTIEYKINFLAAFQGGELRAIGRVVRAGRRIIVTTAEVLHVAADGKQSPCAVMQQTLTTVPATL